MKGFTPGFVTGVWVGYDEQKEMGAARNRVQGRSSHMA